MTIQNPTGRGPIRCIRLATLFFVTTLWLVTGCNGDSEPQSLVPPPASDDTRQVSRAAPPDGNDAPAREESAQDEPDDPAPAGDSADKEPPEKKGPAARSVTLSWEAPEERADGTPLTDLKGFTIWMGRQAENIKRAHEVPIGLTTYVIENLDAGVWFFAMSAHDSKGLESAISDVVSTTIR